MITVLFLSQLIAHFCGMNKNTPTPYLHKGRGDFYCKAVCGGLLEEATENSSDNLFADLSADGICGAVNGFFKYAFLFSS